MTAHRHAVDPGVETEGLRVVNEGQDHAAQSGVGVNVKVADGEVLQYLPDPLHVVDGSPHRRSDGRHYHGRHVPVHPHHVTQVLVVDFPVLLPLDHDVSRVQQPDVLQHAVMGFLGEVEHRVREHLPGQVQAIHVPLGPARSDITPGIFGSDAQQAGEPVDHLSLELVGIAPEIAVMKRVANVVDRVIQKGQHCREIEILVRRVPYLPLARVLNFVQQFVQALLDFRLGEGVEW